MFKNGKKTYLKPGDTAEVRFYESGHDTIISFKRKETELMITRKLRIFGFENKINNPEEIEDLLFVLGVESSGGKITKVVRTNKGDLSKLKFKFV